MVLEKKYFLEAVVNKAKDTNMKGLGTVFYYESYTAEVPTGSIFYCDKGHCTMTEIIGSWLISKLHEIQIYFNYDPEYWTSSVAIFEMLKQLKLYNHLLC